jgi:hypothetical protein
MAGVASDRGSSTTIPSQVKCGWCGFHGAGASVDAQERERFLESHGVHIENGEILRQAMTL